MGLSVGLDPIEQRGRHPAESLKHKTVSFDRNNPHGSLLPNFRRSQTHDLTKKDYKFRKASVPAIDDEFRLERAEPQKTAVMAEEVRRWTVTYTKHVKQKRKVYQDGYLLLSSKKVMLYDDSDKLLDSKFLKGDESLSSGETLTFGSYLVDIGDPENAELAQEENLKKSSGSDRNCTLARQNVSAINTSPSRRIIREFKKNEKIKYALQERSPCSTSSIAGEWQALYTTHLTQKAKKYHDGFIKLVLCGSQGRQAKLYDATKTLLDSRFLKKDDIVSSGESLKFDGYLIDIGDPVNHEKLVNLKAEGQNCHTSETHRAVGRNQSQQCCSNHGLSSLKSRNISRSYVTAHALSIKGKHIERRMNSCGIDYDRVALTESSAPNISLRGGNPSDDACSGKDVESRLNSCVVDADRVRLTQSGALNISFRGAHEILSFLKKPTSPSRTSITEQVPEKQCYPSPDLVILDTDYKESFEERDLLRKQGTQESEDKVAQFEGLTQTNSPTEEAEPRTIPFDISCEIKIEKDCDNDASVQHRSSSAAVFFRSKERPSPMCQGLDKVATTKSSTCSSQPVIGLVPLVDLEQPQPEEFILTSFKGISDSTGNHLSTNTQSGDGHQNGQIYSTAEPRCSVVGEMPKSVNPAFGIGHPCRMKPAETRSSSTKVDDCPSFDLGF